MAGTETYGRVKVVGGTPIVTQFAMLQLLPLYPLQSVYITGPADENAEGIPLVASFHSASPCGYPLAKVDRLSVTMSYLRAICGVILFPCTILMVIFVAMKGQNPAGFEKGGFIQWPVSIFAVSLVTLLLSYWLPRPSARERAIREYCGEILEGCVDPAKVHAAYLPGIADSAEAAADRDDPTKGSENLSFLTAKLVACRVEIARGHEVEAMELLTDDLLVQLGRLES